MRNFNALKEITKRRMKQLADKILNNCETDNKIDVEDAIELAIEVLQYLDEDGE